LRGLYVEAVIAHVVAKTTPFTLSDARLLIELVRETAKALRERGVACRYGTEGEHNGTRLCIPSRWDAAARERHDVTCGHCPVFKDFAKDGEGGRSKRRAAVQPDPAPLTSD
jgi:hypothetical protein